MINEELILQIKKDKPKPIIGVLGATLPNPNEYNPMMGAVTGYLIRQAIEKREGTIFTGGVDGVGLDVYKGIVAYCNKNKVNKKPNDDRFFVLIPHNYQIAAEDEDEEASLVASLLNMTSRKPRKILSLPYPLPESYNDLAKLLNKNVDAVRAGQHMGDRREYVAHVGDAFVVVNGGPGTFDEVYNALELNKPVITMSKTGGAAEDLSLWKEKGVETPRLAAVRKFGLDFSRVDYNLIHPVQEMKSLDKKLEEIVYR